MQKELSRQYHDVRYNFPTNLASIFDRRRRKQATVSRFSFFAAAYVSFEGTLSLGRWAGVVVTSKLRLSLVSVTGQYQ